MNSLSSINSIIKYCAVPPKPQPIIISFQSGSPTTVYQNGFTLVSFLNTGTYNFTLTGGLNKVLYFCVVGGGSSGQGRVGSQYGGTGGSGGQTIYGSYTIATNSSTAYSVTVGLGGHSSYCGNGNKDGSSPVSGYDTSGTSYGTNTTRDIGNSGVCCSGGFSQLVSLSSFGTIKALGGTTATVGFGGPPSYASSCPSSAGSLGTGTATTFYQGKPGGLAINTSTSVGGNGVSGSSLSIAGGTNMVFGSSGGGSQLNGPGTQSTPGTNAGYACGGTPSTSYQGWMKNNGTGAYDGFPALANFGAGGGGACGSGGNPYSSSGAFYDRQAGGYGGSGVVYIWY